VFRRVVKKLVSLGDRPRPGTPPAGEPARGIVRYYFGDEPEAGVTQQWYWRTVDVALADDPDGPATRVEVYLNRRAHGALRIGAEIPVRVQPGTRSISGIDPDAFEAEIAARTA
jgi:hypothetical protein